MNGLSNGHTMLNKPVLVPSSKLSCITGLINLGSIIISAIKAETVFGLRHGLETLSQLITSDNTEKFNNRLLIISAIEIYDQPSFTHRGLHLDSARTFISISVIKRQLDLMALVKLNILHWHLTDFESFSIKIPTTPNLWKYGATQSHVYNSEDVNNLIEYGLVRGIRLIPEIDVPGHVEMGWQWGRYYGIGDLVISNGVCHQLNIFNLKLYPILQELLHGILKIFQTATFGVIHLGGDEVS